METENIRELFLTDEFLLFYNTLSQRVQTKFDYVMDLLKTERIINAKFVKHLINSDLYEMRVSVGSNEYRTILFSIDNNNIILSTRVILLNAFLKKSNNDYNKQIKKAEKLLKYLTNEDNQ